MRETMPEPTKKQNPPKRAPNNAPQPSPTDAPKGTPIPQDDADECDSNADMPSSGKRKPKCHEGYPEQQPSDSDAG
jgi:hypothetical protein